MKFVKVLNDDRVCYPSYADFFRLVELAGFETVEQDEIDLYSNEAYCLYIRNGNCDEWASPGRKRNCRFILWQLERCLGDLVDFAPPEYNEVWVSDRALAAKFKDDSRVRYVPVGGHPGLGGEPSPVKTHDLTVQCYSYGRRQAIIDHLKDRNYTFNESCWPPKRDEMLATARAGLCLHQHDNDFGPEPLRATTFAMWKLPLIFEHCIDPFPYSAYTLEEIREAMVDGRGYAAKNYELLTGPMSFRECVLGALA